MSFAPRFSPNGEKIIFSLVTMIDELIIYMSPCILGKDAIDMFAFPAIEKLSDRYSFVVRDLKTIGTDMKLILRKNNV